MQPKTKRLFYKILPYPIIFILGGLMYVDLEIGLLGNSKTYPATGAAYDPFNSFLSITILTFILGFILGSIEEMGFKERFKNLPFGIKVILKTFIYIFLFVSFLFISSLFLNAANMGKPAIDAESFDTVIDFYTSFSIVSIIIYTAFIISIALFFSEIVDYLGLDIVGNFFSGKYSKPVFEKRIFMFLDMKDSTTIAEKIGHKRQHELINDYYNDMSEAIVKTNGSIYQYVGDEIVVSWELEQGIENNNCLRCFFLIEKRIAEKSENYKDKYGVLPGFKAGFHCGEVTRGQIGEIKRDLLYIGDVLNATARIQGLCNQLQSNLLISSVLKEHLPENTFKFSAIGEFELKGRQKKEALYSVENDK